MLNCQPKEGTKLLPTMHGVSSRVLSCSSQVWYLCSIGLDSTLWHLQSLAALGSAAQQHQVLQLITAVTTAQR